MCGLPPSPRQLHTGRQPRPWRQQPAGEGIGAPAADRIRRQQARHCFPPPRPHLPRRRSVPLWLQAPPSDLVPTAKQRAPPTRSAQRNGPAQVADPRTAAPLCQHYRCPQPKPPAPPAVRSAQAARSLSHQRRKVWLARLPWWHGWQSQHRPALATPGWQAPHWRPPAGRQAPAWRCSASGRIWQWCSRRWTGLRGRWARSPPLRRSWLG
mmetsp:Transcript_43212/g.110579  ORF Transcript_43212/g.110579 Transcript_43212/m.110579 type:complete len:210 (-) Transcript_43212:99-728(-)